MNLEKESRCHMMQIFRLNAPEPALSRHSPADPPAVLGVLHGVVTLPDREPHLVQHRGEPVGDARSGVQLPRGEQRVREPEDGVTVLDPELLQVPE